MKTNLIKRTKRTKNFTIISNDIVNRPDLSFEAKGFLCYVISLPDDWVIHKSYISSKFNIGKHKVSKMFKELEKAGYMVSLDMIHENGRWQGKNYLFYDEPIKSGEIEKITDADFQSTEKQSTEFQSTDNPPLLSTNKDQELKKKKNTKREKSSPSMCVSSSISVAEEPTVAPTQTEVFAVFTQIGKQKDSFAPDLCTEQRMKFFWYYEAREWKLSGGQSITAKNLYASAISWLQKCSQEWASEINY